MPHVKQFFCGDVVPGCTAVFHAEDDQAVLQQVAAHAAKDHGITEVTPDMAEDVLSHIHAASS